MLALWSASGHVAAFTRAANSIHEVEEGRPIWKTAPVRLAVALALVIMLVLALLIVVLTGPIADQVGTAFGIGDTAVLSWLIASALFARYVSFSSSYNKTYGSLTTVTVFLVGLWITNIAILLGVEFNAETQRPRAIRAVCLPTSNPSSNCGTPASCRTPRRSRPNTRPRFGVAP